MKPVGNEEKLKAISKSIKEEQKRWIDISRNGCNDPAWCDGLNMNLVRNHIISYKKQMQNICVETGLSLPSEYYTPTPPKVDNSYMANLEQKDRVERLRNCYGEKEFVREVPKYNENQLSFV